MKRPAFQFYPADWRKDVELQSCSMAAQGLWINAMCIAHECEPYGHLTINGRGMNTAQLGRQVGLSAKEADALLSELFDAGVARRTDEGVYFSQRMVDDEALRNARAAGGKAGAEYGIKGAEAGSKGGRPKAGKGGLETPLVDDEKPPPSSSSSTSVDTPLSPKGETRRNSAIEFKTFLANCKAQGEKPISDYKPIFDYADQVGLPHDFISDCWSEFYRTYGENGTRDAKRYKDWRKTFRGCVERNWFKLWWFNPGTNAYELTTQGQTARRAAR